MTNCTQYISITQMVSLILHPRLNPGAEINQTSLKGGSLETLLKRGLTLFSPWFQPWGAKWSGPINCIDEIAASSDKSDSSQ